MSWLTEALGTAPVHTAAPVREDTSGLIAAINEQERLMTPGVRDRAFSGAAGRGLGDSPQAALDVGSALSNMAAGFATQRADVEGSADADLAQRQAERETLNPSVSQTGVNRWFK